MIRCGAGISCAGFDLSGDDLASIDFEVDHVERVILVDREALLVEMCTVN